MNNICVRRYNKYSNSTFKYILQYIKHTRYHNSILFSGPKKWNEIMKNPYVFHLKKIVLNKIPLKTAYLDIIHIHFLIDLFFFFFLFIYNFYYIFSIHIVYLFIESIFSTSITFFLKSLILILLYIHVLFRLYKVLFFAVLQFIYIYIYKLSLIQLFILKKIKIKKKNN